MTEDRISIEKLARIVEDTPWDAFEATPDGRLLVMDRAQTILPEEEDVDHRPWVFEMRVGLHLDRPTQAIMSCGHFIKLRRDNRWEQYRSFLGVLDPEHPNHCLYTAAGYNINWNPGAAYIDQTYQHYPVGVYAAAGAHTHGLTPHYGGWITTLNTHPTPSYGGLTTAGGSTQQSIGGTALGVAWNNTKTALNNNLFGPLGVKI